MTMIVYDAPFFSSLLEKLFKKYGIHSINGKCYSFSANSQYLFYVDRSAQYNIFSYDVNEAGKYFFSYNV